VILRPVPDVAADQSPDIAIDGRTPTGPRHRLLWSSASASRDWTVSRPVPGVARRPVPSIATDRSLLPVPDIAAVVRQRRRHG
jgi:hypothetical protein